MPVPTDLSFLGVAKEVSKGTGVTPSNYIPLKTISPVDHEEFFPVEVWQGAMTNLFAEIPGYTWTEFEVGGPLFVDTFGWALAGILGDMAATTNTRTVADGVTTITTPGITSATAAFTQNDVGRGISNANFPAGSYILSVQSATAATVSNNATASGSGLSFIFGNAGVFTTPLSLLNSGGGQPTSHTLTDFYAVTQARQYAGIQWQEVSVKFNTDGLLEWTAKGVGLVPSLPVAKPTQSFTSVIPLPTWAGNLNVAGAVNLKGVDGEITLTRKLEVIKAFTGKQVPAAIFLGDLSVKGKLVFYADDDAELIRYLTNTQPALDLLFAVGASNALMTSFQFHASKAAYINAKLIRAKEFMQVETDFAAIANTTDVGGSGGYSPCICRVQSPQNGAYV